MLIPFELFRTQPVKPADNQVVIGNHHLDLGDILDCQSLVDSVPVRAIAQAAEQYARLTGGHCSPQLAALVFAATGQVRALDHYFPILRRLSEAEIGNFYQVAHAIVQNPNFNLQLIDEDGANVAVRAPWGVAQLVAGQIAEVFYHRPAVLERFLAAPRHFQLYTNPEAFRQDGGSAGGDYNPRRESIQLVLARLFEGFFGETAGVCPFLHEFGHMLDHFDAGTGKMGRSAGLLPGLSPRDGPLYRPAARKLFISGKRLELERYLALRREPAQPGNPLPIGHPYVFQNDGEFIAGYLEMFFRSPHYFAVQNYDLHQAFVELFGYDPREAWEEDFSFYVNQNRKFYLSGQQPAPPNLTIPEG
jgi:hypothetical protein